MTQTTENKVISRIYGSRGGKVVMSSDFLDLGNLKTVAKALERLTQDGKIQRLARGVYYLPRKDPILGALLPSPMDIAKGIAASEQAKLLPTGAYAANLLGLSEQVPAKTVFLTNGKTRNLTIAPTQIELRHAEPRTLATAGRLSGLMIQALRHIGKGKIAPAQIEHLRRTIPSEERVRLIKDLKFAPVWMHSILRDVAETR
jgi:Family of unknown function (DUF6088)